MSPYRERNRQFLAYAAMLGLATSALYTKIVGVSQLSLILSPTPVVFVLTTAWLLFDRYLWRTRIAKWLDLSHIPDLNGTWVGSIDRYGENNPHRFELEVRQTYSRVSITTRSDNSQGRSIKSFFVTGADEYDFALIDYWESTVGLKDNTGRTLINGLSHITIHKESGKNCLRMDYFTDRNPPTRGRIILSHA